MRILLLEDEPLIGLDMKLSLEEWGHDVDGPHASVAEAFDAIGDETPEFGILDVHLRRGERSYPIAEHLADAGVPFVFLTGYSSARLNGDAQLGAVTILRKPVGFDMLRRKIEAERPLELDLESG